MLDNIYNQRILELAGNIPRIGRLPRPDATASAYSKLCGSTITVDLRLEDGKVADYAHELKACALGQASASIMARNVVGSTPQELREARDALRQNAQGERPAADRQMGRPRGAGAGARLQGPAWVDDAGV